MKPSDLTELIAVIQEEHPGEEFTKARLAIWYATLGDVPVSLAVEALVICLSAKPFPPKPGDIRRQVDAMLSDLGAHSRLARLNRSPAVTAHDEEMRTFLTRWIYEPRRSAPNLVGIGTSGLLEIGDGE